MNQVFLLLGLRFYNRPASDKHPFGYKIAQIEEVEDLNRRAEPKVELFFLEAARQGESSEHNVVPEQIG